MQQFKAKSAESSEQQHEQIENEMTEHSQESPLTNFYCLYIWEQRPKKEVGSVSDGEYSWEDQLKIMLTDLPTEYEAKLKLKKYLLQKIETNLLQEDGNFGILPTVFLSGSKMTGN
jgi:hypothetical protein